MFNSRPIFDYFQACDGNWGRLNINIGMILTTLLYLFIRIYSFQKRSIDLDHPPSI
jgi:hypothetical protein